MNKRFWFTLLALITIAATLSACVMSASKPPAATSTANKAFPTPVPGTVIDNIQSQTKTAIALSTQPADRTPEAGQATATPAPAAQGNEPTATTAAPPAEGATAQPAAQPTAVPPTIAPTKAPVMAGPIPTLTRPQTYTLNHGEFPICIARRYDLNMGDLLSINGLNMNSKTSPGLVLKIPQSGNWNSGSRALKPHPTTYTVQAGDSIYDIACAYGDVSPEGIIAANGWKNADALTSGATISIP